MNFIKKLFLFFTAFVLSGCSLFLEPKYSLEDLNSMNRYSVFIGKSQEFSEPISGTFYVLVKKKDLDKISQADLLINGEETKLTNSTEDFNFPSKDGAYFTVKKIELENVNAINVHADNNSKINGIKTLIAIDEK